MKKLTFFAVVMLMSLTFTFATGPKETAKDVPTVSLSGQVLDMVTGEALAGVKVQMEDTSEFSYTDLDGNFSFEGLIPGKYQISTNLISYKTADMEIEVKNTQEVEVKLEQLSRK